MKIKILPFFISLFFFINLHAQNCNNVIANFCSEIEGQNTHFSFSGSEEGTSTYHWDFGDGNVSASKHPVHTYSSTGSFQACLTLTSIITTTTGGGGGYGGGGGTTTTTTCTDLHCGNISISVHGCTDVTAVNYNPLANIDDGSCRYCIYGCTDSIASNYNPLATCDDNSCLDLNSSSLTEDFENYELFDYLAYNSPIWQTWSDPSLFVCKEDVRVNTSPLDANLNGGSNAIKFESESISGGPQDIVLPFGTSSSYNTGVFIFSAMFNVMNSPNVGGAYFNFQTDYNPGNGWALDVFMNSNGQIVFSNNLNSNLLTSTYPSSIWFELKIAVDITNNLWEVYIDNALIGSFSNGINQIASLDLFPLEGNSFWVDDIYYMYNTNLIYGCTDQTMFNYNINATWDDGTCIPHIYGCIDSTMFNYNVNANTDDGTCIPYIYGCTDPTMFNYDPAANTDDGTCLSIIYGCIDMMACNYDINANTDDSTCDYNSVSYDTLTSNMGVVWNSIYLNISGDYTIILTNSVGCDSIVNLNLTMTSITSITNITNSDKTLLKITNIAGQNIPYRRNEPVFYIYEDGTIEKKIIIE